MYNYRINIAHYNVQQIEVIKMKTCSKCLKNIDDSKEDYVMLISKTGQKIREFFVFHKKCWMEHFKEYFRRV